MNKKHILTVALAGLVFTSGGWVVANDNTNKVKKVLEDKIEIIEQKSTEIAKLEDVIVIKDKKLDAEKQVIEKQKDQLNDKQEEIDKLKKELKKKPKVVEKVVYKQANFKEEKEGSDVIRTLTMNASGYIAMCNEGCSGKTRTGYDVTNTIYYQGMRVIASDLSILPMYSIVEIEGFSERFIVLDTGGAIDGNKIDILFSSTSEAVSFGRKDLEVKVIRNGK